MSSPVRAPEPFHADNATDLPERPALRPVPDDVFIGWRPDARAGLVVSLVALPLCLGVALASGAPLLAGLITGVIGGVIVAKLSGSQLMVSGPAAGLTAIVAASILELGSFQTFLLSVVVAGALQLLLYVLRAGIIAYFFPSSVIKGMLAAIGLTLVLSQLPYALGAGISTGSAGGKLAVLNAFDHLHAGALVLTLISLAILIAWDHPRFAKAKSVIPAPLLVVTVALIAGMLFTGSPLSIPADALVKLPPTNDLNAILMLPDWSQLTNPLVYSTGAAIALVASLETLLSLEATDKLDPLKRSSSANRELRAQGIGNMLCGLAGGLPMTGVIVRSAVNVDAGGRTWRSAFLHGVFLATMVITLASLINRIPLAALASILIYTGFKLAHPKVFRGAITMGTKYALPFVATIAAILMTDLLVGIMIGLAIGAFFILLESYNHAYVFDREESADHHRIKLRLAEEVSFLNKVRISRVLNELPAGSSVLIDGSQTRYLDPDVVEIIHDYRDRSKTKDITVRLRGIPDLSAAPLAH